MACLLSELTLPNASWAAAPDYTCYIQIGSTQVVDLTRSVCRFDSEEVAKAVAAKAAYLSSVKKLVESDESILSLINSSPELMITAAQNYCAARQSGMSEKQYIESQYQELMSTLSKPSTTLSETSTVNSDSEQMKQYETTFVANGLATELAPNHYCPGAIRR